MDRPQRPAKNLQVLYGSYKDPAFENRLVLEQQQFKNIQTLKKQKAILVSKHKQLQLKSMLKNKNKKKVKPMEAKSKVEKQEPLEKVFPFISVFNLWMLAQLKRKRHQEFNKRIEKRKQNQADQRSNRQETSQTPAPNDKSRNSDQGQTQNEDS